MNTFRGTGAPLACILTPADEKQQRRGFGVWKKARDAPPWLALTCVWKVISRPPLSLLLQSTYSISFLWPSTPVKTNLFMYRAAIPPTQPGNLGVCGAQKAHAWLSAGDRWDFCRAPDNSGGMWNVKAAIEAVFPCSIVMKIYISGCVLTPSECSIHTGIKITKWIQL